MEQTAILILSLSVHQVLITQRLLSSLCLAIVQVTPTITMSVLIYRSLYHSMYFHEKLSVLTNNYTVNCVSKETFVLKISLSSATSRSITSSRKLTATIILSCASQLTATVSRFRHPSLFCLRSTIMHAQSSSKCSEGKRCCRLHTGGAGRRTSRVAKTRCTRISQSNDCVANCPKSKTPNLLF